jgi:hypothetical protein
MFKEAVIVLVIMAASGTHDRVQSITVERGPCLGTCPVYRFEATADVSAYLKGAGSLPFSASGVFQSRRKPGLPFRPSLPLPAGLAVMAQIGSPAGMAPDTRFEAPGKPAPNQTNY